MKIISYNIHHGKDAALDMSVIAADIADADVVCLQEVDRYCTRSGNTDEAALIANAGKFPYYEFIKAINLGDGEYGCAILSKFPLNDFRIVPLESGKYEKRACGIATVAAKKQFLIYCTHLSFENAAVRTAQFAFLKTLIEEPFVLCGDFNVATPDEYRILPWNCANTSEKPLPTFIEDGAPIDNVITNGKVTACIRDGHSDHRILEAEVVL